MSASIEHLKQTRSTYLHLDLALIDVGQLLDVFNQSLRVLVTVLEDVRRLELVGAGHFGFIVKVRRDRLPRWKSRLFVTKSFARSRQVVSDIYIAYLS